MSEDNSQSKADPATESRHREYRHGVFVPGNIVSQAKDLLKEDAQGSWGLGLDQGEHRVSHRQNDGVVLNVGQDLDRITKDKQGSQMHLGKYYAQREQEDRF